MLSQDINLIPNFKSFLKNEYEINLLYKEWAFIREAFKTFCLLKTKRFERIHSKKTDTREILPDAFSKKKTNLRQ